VPDEQCAKLARDLTADGIAVLDTRDLKVLRVLQAGSDPEQFDLSRDGRKLYVSNEDSATASVVDVANGAVLTRVAVGHEPEGVRVSPDGAWAVITSETDNAVSFLDTRALRVTSTAPVGHRPRDLAFTPDGHAAYVSGEFDASVYRITVPAGQPVQKLLQLRKEARPMSVLLDAARHRLYVSTGRGGTIAVVALTGATGTLVKEIPVGARPWGIALTPDRRYLYAANGPSNDVSVIDTSSLAVVKTIAVGRSPWGVVISR
jgi:YVTN family beta-propeller protein